MSIWYHPEHRNWIADRDLAFQAVCFYCHTPLIRHTGDENVAAFSEEMNYGWSDKFTTRATAVIGICPACGWWKYGLGTAVGGRETGSFEFAAAILKSLDLSNLSIPIKEVRAYLTAKYQSRFDVHPRVFEEVVGSVFRAHGCAAEVTSYSGDGGIDVIVLEGATTIGVQVKRYAEKNKISVDQIRELAGSLFIQGHTKGIFVTTSAFQAGAETTAAGSGAKGIPIELIDAPKFYEKLKIAQLSNARELIDRKPWGSVRKWGD